MQNPQAQTPRRLGESQSEKSRSPAILCQLLNCGCKPLSQLVWLQSIPENSLRLCLPGSIRCRGNLRMATWPAYPAKQLTAAPLIPTEVCIGPEIRCQIARTNNDFPAQAPGPTPWIPVYERAICALRWRYFARNLPHVLFLETNAPTAPAVFFLPSLLARIILFRRRILILKSSPHSRDPLNPGLNHHFPREL